jgi:hypothetical protein
VVVHQYRTPVLYDDDDDIHDEEHHNVVDAMLFQNTYDEND